MIRKLLPLLCIVALLLTGCHRLAPIAPPSQPTEPTDPESGLILGAAPPMPEPREDNTYAIGQEVLKAGFSSSLVGYTVDKVSFCQSFKEAGIDVTDEKHFYPSTSTWLLDDDGEAAEGVYVVVLDLTVRAVDAPDGSEGTEEKNEHMMGLKLRYGDGRWGTEPNYFAFEETEEIHRSKLETGFYHFWLPKGETVPMTVAFPLPPNYYPQKSIYLELWPKELNLGYEHFQYVLLHEGEEK